MLKILKKLILSSGAGILFFVFPLFVSAQASVSVQAQIDALLNQISKLQTQITALRAQSFDSVGDSSRCVDLEHSLVIGSTNATTNGEVSKLQQFLVAAGVYPEARITGYYGLLTAQAVVRWQKAHGMDFVTTASGVGPMTRAKLRAACLIALESQIQSAVNQALAGSAIAGYQPIPKGSKLLSTKVAINNNVVAITLNFNAEITADGEGAFEDTFRLVSNTIHSIVQGQGKDPKYAGLNYSTLIDGQPLNEVVK